MKLNCFQKHNFNLFIGVLLGVPVFGSLILFVSTFDCYIFELALSVAPLAAVLSLVLSALGYLNKSLFMSLFGIASAMLHWTLINNNEVFTDAVGVADFEIAQFNLYHFNSSSADVAEVIEQAQADIITVQELNPKMAQVLSQRLSRIYSHSILYPHDACCYGIGVFSKFPIVKYNLLQIAKTPVLVVHVIIGGVNTTIYSLHTRPPAFPNEMDLRDYQLNSVAAMAGADTNSCIVIGDFNIVAWDKKFSYFLEQGGLTHLNTGFDPTYPADFGVPIIPIDHITYSGNLNPIYCKTVAIPGSDHRGLMAGFAFKE